jgi:hypothetical protein
MENNKNKTEFNDSAWLIPTKVQPKKGQYLKTAYVKFVDGNPIHYYTLHSPKDIEK